MEVKEIFWSWHKGDTLFKVFYSDDQILTLHSDKVPPTNPTHDIAHIICCFSGMPWNFKLDVNQIAEYNAVYMENIFTRFCRYYLEKNTSSIEDHIEKNRIETKDFSDNYYKIPENCQESTERLERVFMQSLDPEICSLFIMDYLQVYELENVIPKEHISTSLTFNLESQRPSKAFYNFICDYKKTFFESYDKYNNY